MLATVKVIPFAAHAADSPGRRDPEPTAGLWTMARRLELTRREETIVAGLLAGRRNKAIARDLGITEQSVKNRLSQLYRKFGVRNRLELVLALSRDAHAGGL